MSQATNPPNDNPSPEFGILGSPQCDHDFWLRTRGYGPLPHRYDYLTPDQNRRAERTRICRMLFRGWHREAYLHEGRTQYPFPELRVEGRAHVPYLKLNLLKAVVTTINDLLLGSEPRYKAGDDTGKGGQDEVDLLIKRTDAHSRFVSAKIEAGWAGYATAEVCVYDNEVYIQNVPPGQIYPLGPMLPDGQYAAYLRFATAMSTRPSSSPSSSSKLLLLETTYTPGLITRACYFLDGTKKGDSADLSWWPTKGANGSDLLDRESVPGDVMPIVWMNNWLDEGRDVSDMDGLVDLQDEINHSRTQIKHVFVKHGTPKMALPIQQANTLSGGALPSDYSAYYFNSPEMVPKYLTWDARLGEAMENLRQVIQDFCTEAELSPVLLGIKGGATPDAARKLRLEATKSLSMAARRSAFVRPFIRTCLDTAIAMNDARRPVSAYVTNPAYGQSSVTLSDGLPQDDLDEAQVLTTLTGGKPVMSVKRAVEILNPDPGAAAAEMVALKEQADAATPPMLFGTQHEDPTSPPSTAATAADTKAEVAA